MENSHFRQNYSVIYNKSNKMQKPFCSIIQTQCFSQYAIKTEEMNPFLDNSPPGSFKDEVHRPWV